METAQLLVSAFTKDQLQALLDSYAPALPLDPNVIAKEAAPESELELPVIVDEGRFK